MGTVKTPNAEEVEPRRRTWSAPSAIRRPPAARRAEKERAHFSGAQRGNSAAAIKTCTDCLTTTSVWGFGDAEM